MLGKYILTHLKHVWKNSFFEVQEPLEKAPRRNYWQKDVLYSSPSLTATPFMAKRVFTFLSQFRVRRRTFEMSQTPDQLRTGKNKCVSLPSLQMKKYEKKTEKSENHIICSEGMLTHLFFPVRNRSGFWLISSVRRLTFPMLECYKKGIL